MIAFNKPCLTGKEIVYIQEALETGKFSGNGLFTSKIQSFFERKYQIRKCLLTTSCTDALEMCALLFDIKPEDEIIIPSFTFVSTALAFARQGARIIFADSKANHPGIDETKIESLITGRTKAIVPMHYGGVSCNMDLIMDVAKKYELFVVEDAAHSLDGYFTGINGETKALGTIGHLATFSFHETKNIQCGEGGLLAVNDDRFINRSEIVWEKGTNRAEFFRGNVNKYGWVDTGSSFLPSEITAAFLWAQIESLAKIQERRKKIWEQYYEALMPVASRGYFDIPEIPTCATNNGHIFYLVCNSLNDKTNLIKDLMEHGIMAVFHYQSLHKSSYYAPKHDGRELPNCDRFSDCLVRLPLYYDLSQDDQNFIISVIKNHYL